MTITTIRPGFEAEVLRNGRAVQFIMTLGDDFSSDDIALMNATFGVVDMNCFGNYFDGSIASGRVTIPLEGDRLRVTQAYTCGEIDLAEELEHMVQALIGGMNTMTLLSGFEEDHGDAEVSMIPVAAEDLPPELREALAKLASDVLSEAPKGTIH